MNDLEEIKGKLKSAGIKLTTQRIAILNILHNNHKHPTALSIYKKLRLKQPTVSFTTVYNTLELLTRLGEIRKLTVDFERAHYDPATAQHHHAICTVCGAISDVEDIPDIRVDDMLVDNFSNITDFHVDFFGTCNKCNKSS
jgi:Fur family transcriptional regulator, peroxide stress response regulator